MEKNTINLTIEPGFIEKIAREKLENNDIKAAYELLNAFFKIPDLSDDKKFILFMKLLDGSARTNHDNTIDIDDEDPNLNANHPIFQQAEKMRNEIAQLKENLSDIEEKYNDLDTRFRFVTKNLDHSEIKDLSNEYEYEKSCNAPALFENYYHETPINSLLDSFLKFQKIEKESDISYGWLEPNGTFHPVEWCKHVDFANEYTKEHCELPDEYTARPDDFLREKLHWILIHNPSGGMPDYELTDNQNPTKAQQEFLYDYFNKINMSWKANLVFTE